SVRPLAERSDDFAALLRTDPDDPAFASIRAAETTGRPLGGEGFVAGLERRLGRPLAPRPRGRKPKAAAVAE
ncbi:MAG TPA: hypothetical protein VFE03_10385, partial [Caulobacteraceae bacterium]|nr:hypothetical protein [Caulobacteraceae bacterium]